jgi:hypothetical protein
MDKYYADLATKSLNDAAGRITASQNYLRNAIKHSPESHWLYQRLRRIRASINNIITEITEIEKS